jgi:hypothetical protein
MGCFGATFGTSSACAFYFMSRITFVNSMHFVIKELNIVIIMVTNLQYINLVLILKQHFRRLYYMLSWSLNTDEDLCYRRSSTVAIIGYDIKKSASRNYYNFNEFRIIYCELHDILCLINEKYGI